MSGVAWKIFLRPTSFIPPFFLKTTVPKIAWFKKIIIKGGKRENEKVHSR